MDFNYEEFTFEIGAYQNGNTAILAYTEEGECYGDVTYNLGLPCEPNTGYGCNDSQELLNYLVEKGLIIPTGTMTGFNMAIYKQYLFTDEFLSICKEM